MIAGKGEFRRSVDFVYESVWVLVKRLGEYKINLYLGLMTSFSYIFGQIIFLISLELFAGDLIGWEFEEYVFYLIVANMMGAFAGMFYYARILHDMLLAGQVNVLLTRPLNVFLQQFMYTVLVEVGLEVLIHLVALVVFFVYYSDSFVFLRAVLLVPFVLLGALLEMLIGRFFDGCSFFMKRNNFMNNLYSDVKHTFCRFPAHIFDGPVRMLSFFVGSVYFGVYSTLFMFGRISYDLFFVLFCIVALLDLILVLLIFALWRFGLKRYEAFG
jgi:ABC-type uncharacterized transport system permease subunit